MNFFLIYFSASNHISKQKWHEVVCVRSTGTSFWFADKRPINAGGYTTCLDNEDRTDRYCLGLPGYYRTSPSWKQTRVSAIANWPALRNRAVDRPLTITCDKLQRSSVRVEGIVNLDDWRRPVYHALSVHLPRAKFITHFDDRYTVAKFSARTPLGELNYSTSQTHSWWGGGFPFPRTPPRSQPFGPRALALLWPFWHHPWPEIGGLASPNMMGWIPLWYLVS